jgi:hypothetical protein
MQQPSKKMEKPIRSLFGFKKNHIIQYRGGPKRTKPGSHPATEGPPVELRFAFWPMGMWKWHL